MPENECAHSLATRPKLQPTEIRRQLEKILASKIFSRTGKLRRFLVFTVEETLSGATERLKEYTIGLEVFERDSSYDPRIDPVVRVQAMRLRSKLEEYYATAGKEDCVLIEYVKGSYSPVFKPREPAISTEARPRWLFKVSLLARVRSPRVRIAAFALGLLFVVAAVLVLTFHRSRPAVNQGCPPSALKQLTSDPGLTTDPALSRDGSLLAYSSDKDGHDQMELWLQQTDGTDSVQLTHDGMNNREPSFSPDGTRIAFRSERHGGGIYIMSALGGPARLLAPGGREPRFSPDGRWVTYWTGERHTAKMGGRRVYTVAVAGGSPKRPTSPFTSKPYLGASFASWLPDGRHLLVYGWDGKGPADWWVLPHEGGEPVTIGLTEGVFLGHGLSPPQGNAVSNLALAGDTLVFSARQGDSTNLWRIRLVPGRWQPVGKPERLTFGSATEVNPAVGGKRLAFVSSSFSSDIWLLPLDANSGTVRGELKRIVQNPAQDSAPSVSESAVVFVSDRTGIAELWIRDSANGVERKLTDGLNVGSPCLSRDGRKVAFTLVPRDPRKEKSKIGVLTVGRGNSVSLYELEGSPIAWSGDGRKLLLLSQSGRGVSVVLWEPSSGRSATILKPFVIGHHIFEAAFSPDNRWIAFYVMGPTRRGVYLAPFHEFAECPPSEWVALSDGDSSDAWPKWSPDGNLLYFLSDRDGHRCVWGLPINADGHPLGEPRAVFHFHSARLSMSNLENHTAIGLGVQRDAMVFALGERKGNIWMLTLAD